MRTIKFRGKRVDNDEWVYGSYQIRHRRHGILTEENTEHYNYQVKPETVGQFTGLTDKNGREVYEGDLLNIGSERFGFVTNQEDKPVNYEVFVEDFDYTLKRTDLGFNWGKLSRMYDLMLICEVSGNIHDNN